MKKTEPTYFAIEINTGAVNGFYSSESDAIETTESLSKKYRDSKWAVAKTIGDIGAKEDAKIRNLVRAKLDKLLHYTEQDIPVFLNGDPRGYALKIRDEYVRAHDLAIHRDWGGYGILAPEIE